MISYHIPVEDRRVETHRVVKVIHRDNGQIAVRTQGDNNDNVDPWTATLEGDTVWEVQTVIPKLGSAIRFLRADAVQHGIFWVAFGGLHPRRSQPHLGPGRQHRREHRCERR